MLAGEVATLIGEATQALSTFDTPALEAMHIRAQNLRALAVGGGMGTAEATARLRVFGIVLRETEETLRILRKLRE